MSEDAKVAHDASLAALTDPPEPPAPPELPELTPGPQTDEAIAFVMSKGYEKAAAERIVRENGVDTILAAKGDETPKQPAPPPAQPIISRHGEAFNPDIHAQLPTGDPKTDSTGKFILKEHDYAPKTPNIPGAK